MCRRGFIDFDLLVFCRPGNDLLSRALRQSTIGAEAFHDRVRDGIGCSHFAITTRLVKCVYLRNWNLYDGVLHEIMMITSNENDQANRVISTGKLHGLRHFHTQPINVVVFHGSDREN